MQVRKLNGLTKHTIIIIFGIAMLYPVLWLISSSFKPNELIFTQPGLWSSSFTLDNYINGWRGFQGIAFSKFLQTHG